MDAGLASWQITISRDDITLVIAIIGAALGVFNLWLVWKRERVSLEVIPKSFVRTVGQTPVRFIRTVKGKSFRNTFASRLGTKELQSRWTKSDFLSKVQQSAP